MGKIWIDGDGCCVVDQTLDVAKAFNVHVILVVDSAHVVDRFACEKIIGDQGKDSSDFAIVKRVNKGDIVITQDIGLAALILSKQAFIIHPNGIAITAENIDVLLAQRYHGHKQRKQGHFTHVPKRDPQLDEAFIKELTMCLNNTLKVHNSYEKIIK